jgi:hypothetical protein
MKLRKDVAVLTIAGLAGLLTLIFWILPASGDIAPSGELGESVPGETGPPVGGSSNPREPGSQTGQERQGRHLTFHDAQWPLRFEDGEYPSSLLDLITSDLDGIYSRFENYRAAERVPAKQLLVGGNQYQVESYLDFSISEPYYVPAILAEHFGDILTITGQEGLVVSTTIIDEYQTKLELISNHPGARESLDSFLMLVNGLNSSEAISVLSDVRAREIFYFLSPELQNLPIASLRQELHGLVDYKTGSVTLLNMTEIDDGGQKLLCCRTVKIHRVSGDVPEAYALCYKDGKWRLTF